MSTVIFQPRGKAHLCLPVVTPACLEGGPLEPVPGGQIIRLQPGERMPLRTTVKGGVIAEFYRMLLPIPELDYTLETETEGGAA
jgi:hypothetical protein